MENQSISLFCDDAYLCLLSNRSQDEYDDAPMSDEAYANELQFQETLMSSLATSNRLFPLKKPKLEPTAPESSLSFCEMCAEKRNHNEMFAVQGCRHSFCVICISKYITTTIQKTATSSLRSTSLSCPGLDCKGILDIQTCRRILPSYVIAPWDNMICVCESAIDSVQKFYCPYKDCSSLMVNDSAGEAIREAECLVCRRLVCVQCHVPWHSGFECGEFKKVVKGERATEDLLLHELAKKKNWQRCPRCKFFVEKTDGCLHLTCRCRFEFCYACGEAWSSSHGGCQ